MALLGRQVYVEFGTEKTPGRLFKGLRVGFNVSMTEGRDANEASISIYNLGPSNLVLLQQPQAMVRLYAGYGEFPRIIFAGAPIRGGVHATKQGTDRVVTIEANDGIRAINEGFVVQNFAAPVSLNVVFEACAKAMGLATGFVAPLPLSWPQLYHQGSAAKLLDRIAAISAMRWYIRDNVLYMVPLVASTPAPEKAPIFSSKNKNLIGSPTIKEAGKIKIRGLLDASMRPGKLFVVQSRTLNGPYRATGVTFIGDSGYAQPFYVDVAGVPQGVIA